METTVINNVADHWLVSCSVNMLRVEYGRYSGADVLNSLVTGTVVFSRVWSVESSLLEEIPGILKSGWFHLMWSYFLVRYSQPGAVELSIDWGSIQDIWTFVKSTMVVWPWKMFGAEDWWSHLNAFDDKLIQAWVGHIIIVLWTHGKWTPPQELWALSWSEFVHWWSQFEDPAYAYNPTFIISVDTRWS